MYAIIETGGKQYRVETGKSFEHERLDGVSVGDELSFDKVLLIADNDDVRVGTPYLEGATVSGTLAEEGRGDKVVVYKYKRKKGYRRKQGHRQAYMRTRVTAIVG